MNPPSKELADLIKKYRRHPDFIGTDIVDANQAGGFDDTMLHIAARKGDLEDVKILVASGADVNAIGDIGNTPLHGASSKGRMEVVEFLLSKGADPRIQNEYGETPADWARNSEHHDVVQTLMTYHEKKNGGS